MHPCLSNASPIKKVLPLLWINEFLSEKSPENWQISVRFSGGLLFKLILADFQLFVYLVTVRTIEVKNNINHSNPFRLKK